MTDNKKYEKLNSACQCCFDYLDTCDGILKGENFPPSCTNSQFIDVIERALLFDGGNYDNELAYGSGGPYGARKGEFPPCHYHNDDPLYCEKCGEELPEGYDPSWTLCDKCGETCVDYQPATGAFAAGCNRLISHDTQDLEIVQESRKKSIVAAFRCGGDPDKCVVPIGRPEADVINDGGVVEEDITKFIKDVDIDRFARPSTIDREFDVKISLDIVVSMEPIALHTESVGNLSKKDLENWKWLGGKESDFVPWFYGGVETKSSLTTRQPVKSDWLLLDDLKIGLYSLVNKVVSAAIEKTLKTFVNSDVNVLFSEDFNEGEPSQDFRQDGGIREKLRKEIDPNIVYRDALKKFGIEAQTGMLIEEIGELLQALNKHRRKASKTTMEAIVEEIADVQIMLEQLTQFYRIGNDVEIYKGVKLVKLSQILDREDDSS